MEKFKKLREVMVSLAFKAQKNLKQKKTINSIHGNELATMFKQKGSPKAGQGKNDEKKLKWKAIIDNGMELKTHQPWTEANETE